MVVCSYKRTRKMYTRQERVGHVITHLSRKLGLLPTHRDSKDYVQRQVPACGNSRLYVCRGCARNTVNVVVRAYSWLVALSAMGSWIHPHIIPAAYKLADCEDHKQLLTSLGQRRATFRVLLRNYLSSRPRGATVVCRIYGVHNGVLCIYLQWQQTSFGAIFTNERQ